MPQIRPLVTSQAGKFHLVVCEYAQRPTPDNSWRWAFSRENATRQGVVPCRECKPCNRHARSQLCGQNHLDRRQPGSHAGQVLRVRRPRAGTIVRRVQGPVPPPQLHRRPHHPPESRRDGPTGEPAAPPRGLQLPEGRSPPRNTSWRGLRRWWNKQNPCPTKVSSSEGIYQFTTWKTSVVLGRSCWTPTTLVPSSVLTPRRKRGRRAAIRTRNARMSGIAGGRKRDFFNPQKRGQYG